MTNANQTAEAVAGRATGVLFFTGFGALWLCIGLGALGRLNLLNGIAVFIILAALAIPAIGLLRQARKLPGETPDAERDRRIGRTFGWVNTIQGIAIFAAVVFFIVFKQPAYIVPAIAIIVGLHLFPLARLFQYHAHYVTGALLVVYSAGTVLLLSKEQIPGFGALGTAIILLGSATYTLISAALAVRRRL